MRKNRLRMAENEQLTQIVSGCKDGDSECFSQLIDAYNKRCYGFFYRLTGDRDVSDDLLSELFIRLVERISSYKGGSFESWLFKIASNIFHDYLRGKQRRRKLVEAQIEQFETTAVPATQSDGERIDRLQVQLERLDHDTRELIMLRFYSQMSFKEIATMRCEPIGTTLSKLHRGLKRLRELVE